MNKGLEVIEAHHLFDVEPDEIEVLVHPQSIVHGMVEFRDGSVIAQLGAPDMRIPIAHCLAWPDRIDGPAPRLDLAQIGKLDVREAGPRPLSGARRSPARRCERAAARPRCSMPPTRSRSPNSCTTGSDLPASPPWSRRRWSGRSGAA